MMRSAGIEVVEGYREKQARLRRERQAKWLDRVNKTSRDIGPIAAIADVERREACRFNLLRFAQTYHQESINLELAEFHHAAIARIEEAVLHGAMYCFAMPRGSGKTTWARIAIHRKLDLRTDFGLDRVAYPARWDN